MNTSDYKKHLPQVEFLPVLAEDTTESPVGIHFEWKFTNGFGVSVICNEASYGHESGLWESAVLKADELAVLKADDLCYTTAITDDVIGWLDSTQVNDLLHQIAALGPSMSHRLSERRRKLLGNSEPMGTSDKPKRTAHGVHAGPDLAKSPILSNDLLVNIKVPSDVQVAVSRMYSATGWRTNFGFVRDSELENYTHIPRSEFDAWLGRTLQ